VRRGESDARATLVLVPAADARATVNAQNYKMIAIISFIVIVVSRAGTDVVAAELTLVLSLCADHRYHHVSGTCPLSLWQHHPAPAFALTCCWCAFFCLVISQCGRGEQKMTCVGRAGCFVLCNFLSHVVVELGTIYMYMYRRLLTLRDTRLLKSALEMDAAIEHHAFTTGLIRNGGTKDL
jgi:hypothetical protein